MRLDPYEAPPATPCDPHRLRDLNPSWSCDMAGCACGSTPAAAPSLASFAAQPTEELFFPGGRSVQAGQWSFTPKAGKP